MSHTVSYKFAVVKYAASLLNGLVPVQDFWDDQFILLELCGANNVTCFHPSTGREVGTRHWVAVAGGPKYRVMETAVRSSAFCEDGSLRFYGERDTLPESYIRKVRKTFEKPYSPQEMMAFGFNLAVEIDSKISKFEQMALNLLKQSNSCELMSGDFKVTLNPFLSHKDAAIFLSRELLNQKRSLFGFSVVNGPEFDCQNRTFFGK